jgi:hypothetical protein
MMPLRNLFILAIFAFVQTIQAAPNCEIINRNSGTSFESQGTVRRTLYFTVRLSKDLDYKTCFPDADVQSIGGEACATLSQYNLPRRQVVFAVDSPRYQGKGGLFLHGTCKVSGNVFSSMTNRFEEKLIFLPNGPWKLELELR